MGRARLSTAPGRRALVAVCAVFALAACAVQLAGVLAVGTASILVPSAFPDETVWSRFGQGYGRLPLVLPLLALGWVWHTRPRVR